MAGPRARAGRCWPSSVRERFTLLLLLAGLSTLLSSFTWPQIPLQVEPQRAGSPLLVEVSGSRDMLSRQLPLLDTAFRKHGAHVRYHVPPPTDAPPVSANTAEGLLPALPSPASPGPRSLLLCLNTTSIRDACVVTAIQRDTPYHRVNVIPALLLLLANPKHLCVQPHPPAPGRWLGGELQCHSPGGGGTSDGDGRGQGGGGRGQGGGGRGWCDGQDVLVIPGDLQATPTLVPCSMAPSAEQNGGVTLALPRPLAALGGGAGGGAVRLYLLMSSLSPLRLHLLPTALLLPRLADLFTSKLGRALSLEELEELIGKRAVNLEREQEVQEREEQEQEEFQEKEAFQEKEEFGGTVTARLEEAIFSAMLAVERASLQLNCSVRCAGCFQLLEVAVLLRSIGPPLILQISPWKPTGSGAALSDFLFRQRTLEALAAILVPTVASPVVQVAQGLTELGFVHVRNGSLCSGSAGLCLGTDDFRFALDNRLETLARTSFLKVYPTARAGRFSQLIRASQGNLTSLGSEVSTWSRHSYLLELERFYAKLGQREAEESYDDDSFRLEAMEDAAAAAAGRGEEETSHTATDLGGHSVGGCADDPAWLPYLASLRTQPALSLHPEFSPFRAHYTAEVTYNTLHVRITATARHCQAAARLEDKHNPHSTAILPLGLGENKIRVLVVDPDHVEPWVLNVYTIRVLRPPPDASLSPLIPSTPHTVCRVSQACELRYSEETECGLQQVPGLSSWSQCLDHLASLPFCRHADTPAQWWVPCASCQDATGCHWQLATWQPSTCQHPRLPRSRLRQCLQDRKVLFLGDSTVRGALHYVAEAVNGSLREWDKTHELRQYRGLNSNSTTLAFSYYPQFWLPPSRRPPLLQALTQLLHSSLPLRNSSRTVLVVGGVHWLSSQHLDAIRQVLHREGLGGARVVVKGLGAGFHQPATGLHTLQPGDHSRLLQHNQAVLAHARQLGFRPVDTFNMTMARFSDFLQGKCACHFHRVVQVAPGSPFPGAAAAGSTPQAGPLFRVEGDINAAYSELVINQICG